MYKTKIKRFQLTIDMVLIVFFAMASAVMLASAYGSMCVVYNFPVGPFTYQRMFPAVGRFNGIYVTMNIITWIFAFVWGIVIWAFLTKKRWAHWSAVFTAIMGFISGVIPAFISDTAGFTEPFEGIGSPNWGRALMNLIVLMLLALVLIIPATRKGLLSFTATGGEARMSGNVARQLIMMSLFFFWLAAFSFLGSEFMRNAHIVDGFNVWQTVEIQFFGGIATALTGSSLLAGGLIFHQIKRPTSIIKPVPVYN